MHINHQKYKPSSPEIYIALCLLCGPLSRASVALRRKGFFPLTQSVSLSELGLQVFLLSLDDKIIRPMKFSLVMLIANQSYFLNDQMAKIVTVD